MSSQLPDKSRDANNPNGTQYCLCIAYRFLSNAGVRVILLGVMVIIGSACAREPTPYRPPTLAVRTTLPAAASPTPTSTTQPVDAPIFLTTPACIDNLTFLEDLSLPDGSVVSPGESLDKRWLVQNSGTCNWDERYRLKFISGAELNASIEQALFPARSGAQAILRISFTAPPGPGSYLSTWQAFNPQGQAFGDTVTLQVVVEPAIP